MKLAWTAMAALVCLGACQTRHDEKADDKDASLNYNAGPNTGGDSVGNRAIEPGATTTTLNVREPGASAAAATPSAMPTQDDPCQRAATCYSDLQRQLCANGDTRCQTALSAPASNSDQTVCANAIRDVESRARPYVTAQQTFERPTNCRL
jgi:hypothetical protein